MRIGVFLSAAPLATTFAGALAYGITSGHSRLANWRLLFLVEGLPTIIMAPIAYRFLPVSPEKARFLNEEEALVAKARGVRQVGDGTRVGGIVWSDIGATLADAKAWFTAVRYHLVFTPHPVAWQAEQPIPQLTGQSNAPAKAWPVSVQPQSASQ